MTLREIQKSFQVHTSYNKNIYVKGNGLKQNKQLIANQPINKIGKISQNYIIKISFQVCLYIF